MIEAGLYNLLRSAESVAELIGSRIYPVRVPQEGNAPCIVYSVSNTEFTDGIDDEDNDTLDAEAEQTGPDTARFRLECWGDGNVSTTWAGDDGYKQACRVADAVQRLLRTHKGLMGPVGTTVIECKHIVVEDVRDEETQLEDASDYHRYLRVVDVAIEYDPNQV